MKHKDKILEGMKEIRRQDTIIINLPKADTLIPEIIEWAVNKRILKDGTVNKQAMKVMEELGELMASIIKEDQEGIIDGLGDTMVTLIILSQMLGYDIRHCLQSAYDEIKDRNGRIVNGSFIKNPDV